MAGQTESNGRYLYCITDAGVNNNFGNIGLEENEVYIIQYMDISVLAHRCATKAYDSKDEQLVVGWVHRHNAVVELALNKFDAIVPLRFNTIVKERDGESNEAVEKWLVDQYHDLKRKLDRLRGKQEYGVQIFINREGLLQEIVNKDQRIIELKKKMETVQHSSPGHAYMHKQNLESAVKKELEERTGAMAKKGYSLIKKHNVDVQIEKTKKVEGKTMLLNVSCLVRKENAKQLREELENMDCSNNLSIRITGPWAPYSFV